MNRFLFLFLLACYPYLIVSQEVKSPFLVPRDTVFMGESVQKGLLSAKIVGIKEDKKVTGWNFDPSTNGILLQLESRHSFSSRESYGKTILMANPEDFSVGWAKQTKEVDNTIMQAEDMLFMTIKKNTFRLDPSNGNELWKIKQKLYFSLPEEKIGFFYPHGSSSARMSAVNLKTGKKIWETDQERRYGWDDVLLYDPQTLLIATEGISLYNIYNGKNYRYEAKTAYNDAGQMVLVNILGFLSNVFFAAVLDGEVDFFPYQGKVNTSSNIMSNVCIDENGNLYLASADKIACVSNKGETIWDRKLPKKKTSKSSLFLHNGNVYMLNRGYANYNSNPTLMGEAYLASFNMKTGEEQYCETLYAGKEEAVDNFQVVGNTLFLLMNNRIQTYDLAGGTFKGESSVHVNDPMSMSWFVDGGIYVVDGEGHFRDLIDAEPERIHVMTDHNSVVSLNELLMEMKTYPEEDIYRLYLQVNGFTFLHRQGNTLILHGQTPIAELPFEADGFMTPDNTFYHIGKREIWKINISRYPGNGVTGEGKTMHLN